jgi:outer membrane receptor protein involved in Fe transport
MRTGDPVARAEVSILGRPGVTTTDAEGRFEWKPDPAPPFEVLVVLPGGNYMKPVLVETLPLEGPLRLEVAPLVQEEVTVAASVAPNIITTPASATALLSGRELTGRQPANLMQALENVAGISTVSEGQSAVPAIRGLARGRTLILIDGARVTSERRVGPSASFLDPFVLESVEVSRGPGSVAYGSDAFGGVIYARTRRVEPDSPLGFTLTGGAGLGIPGAQTGLIASKGYEGGGVLAQVHFRDFEDFRSPRGDVFNSGYQNSGFLVRADRLFGQGIVSAGWQSDFGRDVERPRNNSDVVRFFYPTEDSHRLTASYEVQEISGLDRAGLSGFVGKYVVVTDQDRFAAGGEPRSVERADVTASDFHLRGFGERLAGPARLEFGLDLNGRFGLRALDVLQIYGAADTLASETVNLSIDSARRTDVGLYASLESAVAPTVLAAGGARVDRVTTRNDGGFFGDRSTAHTAGSGFASITAGPYGRFSVTGQVSRGFRDPVLSDRYFRGPSGRGFITGNPDLEPETSLQFDGVLRYTASRLRLAIYAFHYRITDLNERFETTDDNFLFRNRGRARIRGVEFEAQAELPAGVSLEVAAQLSRGSSPDDDEALDDLGADSVSLQVRRAFGARGFVQLRGAVYADDDRPGPTEVRVPGHFVLDASGGINVSKAFELRFSARNLLDRAYPISPDPRAVLAPGATLLTTFVARF